ncbi:PepSY domain-containing protein [Anaerococcus murdochii]|uniref:PepSY domain-containing protein n=1 Tax=Anaerococcus murdochii TaxID=411577 RepID=A0ABS7SXN1_9FIRM|nr:PepSY domain-containing protein [Anaerococcus murdochii]MBZ2386312.1 PepSY domain-containing protein [Anaerococcus murdochii]
MNKKLLALLLAGTFVFAGCNQDKAENKEETKQEEQAEKPAEDAKDEGKEEKPEEKADEKTADIVLPDNKVTLKAASYKFESHVVGAPYNLTEVTYEVEDNGEAYYNFEGEKDGKEYKLKVNANSAETTEAEIEKGADKENPVDLGKSIPPEEAMRIALESNGGGTVKEWKLYNDGEGEKYEIELEDGKEITVNAINKKVM